MKKYLSVSISTLIVILLLALMASCDQIEDDVAPEGELTAPFDEEIYLVPNTSVTFDLSEISQNVGSIVIYKNSQRGTISISSEGYMEYKPHAEFTSGSDSFSFSIEDSFGNLLSQSEVLMEMTSIDSLPCFNGALEDKVVGYKNELVNFNVIYNDGYCDNETKGAIVTPLTEPMNGSLEISGLFGFQYTPNENYFGLDSFLYELQLIDTNDSVYTSVAKVSIEILEQERDDCQDRFIITPVDTVYFQVSDAFNEFTFNLIDSAIYCQGPLLDYEIAQNGNFGVVENISIEDLGFIYYPTSQGVSISDFVKFDIYYLDSVFSVERFIVIDVEEENCEFKANFDVYATAYAEAANDTSDYYVIPILENDELCLEEVSVEILSGPAFGDYDLDFEPEFAFSYRSTVPFDSILSDSLVYKITSLESGDTHSSASVVINIYKD